MSFRMNATDKFNHQLLTNNNCPIKFKHEESCNKPILTQAIYIISLSGQLDFWNPRTIMKCCNSFTSPLSANFLLYDCMICLPLLLCMLSSLFYKNFSYKSENIMCLYIYF